MLNPYIQDFLKVHRVPSVHTYHNVDFRKCTEASEYTYRKHGFRNTVTRGV